MSHAVIGMFDTTAAATKAQQQLVAAGIPASEIKMSGTGATTTAVTGTTASSTEDKGFWSSVKEMFGADEGNEVDNHLSYYNEGSRRGGVILTVNATEAQADRAADVLNAAGAVDVDAKSSEWQSSGWKAPVATTAVAATTARAASAGTDAAAAGKIDLVKEDLAVGKRVVNRGGVRIVKRIIERPVSESVSLREEHVSVDRRVVDRPLAGADLTDAFKEGTIEMTESGEEAVAAKTARVVGEVVVGKTVENRTETVKDTLRETDVQVEQLPGQTTTSTTKVVEGTGTAGTTKSTKTGV